jgi:uncharacterized phiE125 gp8 family phage protein
MLIRITGPSVEPVTRDEVKTRFDIDYDDHDDFLDSAIAAARRWIENRTGRVLIEQTWEYRLEDFEAELAIPMLPIMSITSVKYIDEDGDEQTVDGADYFFVDGGTSTQSILMPVDDWPTDVYERPDAVRVRFVAGYEPVDESPVDPASNVPEDLKAAIFMYVGHLYENREAVLLSPVRQELQVLPLGLEELIAPYIVPRL